MGRGIQIPAAGTAQMRVDGRDVRLTNLDKVFWAEEGISKGQLHYYADVAPLLLPHIRNRAMVMKRYPHGAATSSTSPSSTTAPLCCG